MSRPRRPPAPDRAPPQDPRDPAPADALPDEAAARPLPSAIHGRGTALNPTNRFVEIEVAPDPEAFDPDEPPPPTRVYRDATRTILARNDSPDVGFEFSVNPYRGCEHGCIYCYARPFHEYLGFSPGLDFETRVMVKEDAPSLLRAELSKRSWRPQTIVFSGVTDCYQPLERHFRLTRRCLEVMLEFRNPAAIITKSGLVTRDLDVLRELAKFRCIAVNVSVTSLDERMASVLEPRAARPAKRLETIRALADAGIPVRAMVAPVVPGLTDHEIPAIVQAVAAAGARAVGYVVLRLPHAVKDLFATWLDDHFPHAKQKVIHRLESLRGGLLYDSSWGKRQRGEGPLATEIADLFRIARARAGLAKEREDELSTEFFRVPGPRQGSLF